jgi:hypothetical protein
MELCLVNMMNVHTLTVSSCHLISTLMLLFGSQLLQITSDMICCSSISIPGWNNIVGGGGDICTMFLFGIVALIKSVPALDSTVA